VSRWDHDVPYTCFIGPTSSAAGCFVFSIAIAAADHDVLAGQNDSFRDSLEYLFGVP